MIHRNATTSAIDIKNRIEINKTHFLFIATFCAPYGRGESLLTLSMRSYRNRSIGGGPIFHGTAPTLWTNKRENLITAARRIGISRKIGKPLVSRSMAAAEEEVAKRISNLQREHHSRFHLYRSMVNYGKNKPLAINFRGFCTIGSA